MNGPGTPPFYTRTDHELVGRVLAERLRRRTDRNGAGDEFRVVGKEKKHG